MSGPGVYVPDVTEGITRVEDLPQPRIKLRSRNFSCLCCPFCGGAVAAGVWPPAPFMISATPSAADRSTCIFATPTHRCLACRRSFPADQSDLAPLKSQYTHRVQHRKAQKSIYSVRTAEHIRQRIALDMQRDQQAPGCAYTTKALHQARSGTKKLQE